MKRRYELDLCRISACFMVMLIHTSAEIYRYCPMFSSSFTEINFIATFARGSVPVFFMLSGTLLLSREELPLAPFLKNHALKLAGLFFFWSVFYAAGSRVAAGSFALDYDFFMAVARGHYHLWFLPAMVVCYLFMPLVFCAIHGKKIDSRYLLALFFGFVILWRNLNLTPKPAYILHQFTLDFSLDWLPYLGYAVWGWWLGERKMPKHTMLISSAVFVVCTLLAARGNLWYSRLNNEAEGWLFHYMSLPSFIQATCIFCFFNALRGHEFKHTALIRTLSDCTLGVYLIHPLMIDLLDRVHIGMTADYPALSVTGFTALLALLCFAVTFIARKIPIVKKLL